MAASKEDFKAHFDFLEEIKSLSLEEIKDHSPEEIKRRFDMLAGMVEKGINERIQLSKFLEEQIKHNKFIEKCQKAHLEHEEFIRAYDQRQIELKE